MDKCTYCDKPAIKKQIFCNCIFPVCEDHLIKGAAEFIPETNQKCGYCGRDHGCNCATQMNEQQKLFAQGRA